MGTDSVRAHEGTVFQEEFDGLWLIGYASVALPQHPALIVNTVEVILRVEAEEYDE
jgi:hypothetical protein